MSIKFEIQSDPFYKKIYQRVQSELKVKEEHSFANHYLLLKGGFWLLSCAGFYSLMIANAATLWLMYIYALGFAFSLFFLVVNTCHDAVHGSLTENKPINYIFTHFLMNLLGVDGRMWAMRHAHSHHYFPNVKGCDADLDETELIRLSPHAKHFWFHRYQHLYAPFVYSILNVHSVFYQDFVYLNKTELANLKGLKNTKSDLFLFWVNKLIYFSVWIGIPWYMTELSLLTIIAGYILVTMPLSFAFMPIGITHLNEHACHFNPQEEDYIPTSFARYQILSSVDFNPTSKLWTFLYGGLNAHAAHHLFPALSHRHYAWITEIIQEECRNFKVPYKKMGFLESWVSHFKYLEKMGRGEKTQLLKSMESSCG